MTSLNSIQDFNSILSRIIVNIPNSNNHLLQIRLETHFKFKYKIRIRIRIPFVIQVQTLFTSSASSSIISAPLNSSSSTPALINLHNSTVITIYCGKLNWFLTFVASTFLAMSMALPLLHPRWSHRLPNLVKLLCFRIRLMLSGSNKIKLSYPPLSLLFRSLLWPTLLVIRDFNSKSVLKTSTLTDKATSLNHFLSSNNLNMEILDILNKWKPCVHRDRTFFPLC